MVYLTLGSILLLRVVQNITSKSCSKLMPNSPHGIVSYISLRMGISAAIAFIVLVIAGNISVAITEMSPLGWILSILTGLCIAITTVCSLITLRYTSIVLSSLFGAAGLLVPTIAGIFIYDQSVSIGQWLGISLLFVATVFLTSSSCQTNGKLTFKTMLLLIARMLSNGSTMLLQTLYKTYIPKGSVSLYSFLQFALPSILLLLVTVFWSVNAKTPIPKTDKKLLGYTFFAAAAVFGISQISTLASTVIPIAVLFPISDGGGMVISAIVAATIFREKLTVKSTTGIMIGIVALVMIKLLV